ncbi:50S ribosomal protein L18 [Candidatus Nomurabacteria bacterium]|nr:50S ribosomal protein L18 [Candidatus Nomurabacteria bacterium]
MQNKNDKRTRLKKKIRVKISGTEARPRLTVFRSNKFIYAQVINDAIGKTLAQASDLPRLGKAGVKLTKGSKTERAKEVGRMIAEACVKMKIKKVVFDRNAFKYTGRIKLVADAARSNGLEF